MKYSLMIKDHITREIQILEFSDKRELDLFITDASKQYPEFEFIIGHNVD